MSKQDEAGLILKLYELRRDETMRKARDWFAQEFHPTSFEDSMQVDEAYMKTQGVGVVNDWNYVHNLMYLIADLMEAGRLREATEDAQQAQRVLDAVQDAAAVDELKEPV